MNNIVISDIYLPVFMKITWTCYEHSLKTVILIINIKHIKYIICELKILDIHVMIFFSVDIYFSSIKHVVDI